ncbi:MAG: hypothetical protein SCARUB_00940 [Candidatus Scalindua rubra]|uniref:Uncharacterized protein n=1 Tax=Candidatus Scalindua rubra TaxID=1872076 RepID=A0A1E3XEA1_9BACT|nr:MAG: hypothetical protein SCARUB_00940 [Candidatus Scalindua rubra]
MVKFEYTDNFLKSLSTDHQRQIEDKIASMGFPSSVMEEYLDRWFLNFRDMEEKEIALNIFLEIDYFNEHRIEKLLLTYKTKIH